MGWTTCNATFWKHDSRGRRKVDRKKECDRICTWERKEPVTGMDGHIYPPMKDTVLKSAMVGSVYYAAIRREQEGKEPFVWCAIFLTCGRDKFSDGNLWGYKDMCETSCPYFYDCPKGILDLLTPTEDETAREWRDLCRKRLAEKAEERKHLHDPLFTPLGVYVEARRGSWVFSSQAYRNKNPKYVGIRYRKSHYGNYCEALKAFLTEYGTDGQKKAFADSGLDCPKEWEISA